LQLDSFIFIVIIVLTPSLLGFIWLAWRSGALDALHKRD
jgi:hypothetical protein